jgi:hypothetical protein
MKYTRTPIFSFQSNEASVLEHYCVYIFSTYSIKVELHDRTVCFAHLYYGLTRIDLSFLRNHRSNWVVIIGLELLSLSCPGLDLGSCYVTSYYLCHPCYYYGYSILLVWRIGFGVTGMELLGAMPTVQGFVRCDTGSLWLVIIPKSKDRFMERPPMKTVQP